MGPNYYSQPVVISHRWRSKTYLSQQYLWLIMRWVRAYNAIKLDKWSVITSIPCVMALGLQHLTIAIFSLGFLEQRIKRSVRVRPSRNHNLLIHPNGHSHLSTMHQYWKLLFNLSNCHHYWIAYVVDISEKFSWY